MSFLWGAGPVNSQESNIQGESKCKDCTDKNKRLVDYDLFFNELQSVLKKKEGEISEQQNTIQEQKNTINELNAINENIEFTIITLNAHKGRLERELEKQKSVFQEEKKKWLDDKLAFENNQNNIHDDLVFYRELNTRLENELEDEKLIWKQHKKVLEEKIELLNKDILDSKNKIEALEAQKNQYEEDAKYNQEQLNELSQNFKISEAQYLELAKKYARDMTIQEEEFKEKEEDLIARFRERIESLEESLEEKEQLWHSREEEYEFMIQRYQENEDEYELKIQELKYETQYELDQIQNSYRKKEDDTLDYWENRIQELNDNYDKELLTIQEKQKARETTLKQEKEYLEFDLRKEIEDLKIENEKIMMEKKDLEKKKLDILLENKGLKSDNEWLELQWVQEQDQIENLRNQKDELEESQKKMELEILNLKEEMIKNQKILEESLNQKNNNPMESKVTQTLENTFWQPENHMDLVDLVQNESITCPIVVNTDETDLISSCIQGGLRKRNHHSKKKNKKYVNEEKSNFVHPSVYEMSKDEEYSGSEKKNITIEYTEKEQPTNPRNELFVNNKGKNKLLSQWNKIDSDFHIIDIASESSEDEKDNFYSSSYGDSSNDSGNFFLRMTGLVSKFINPEEEEKKTENKIVKKTDKEQEKEQEKDLEAKLAKYEKKMKELEDKNKEYLNKIQNYECQNILDFNRKIRSGIPIKFFPCHTVNGLSSLAHKEPSFEYDLH